MCLLKQTRLEACTFESTFENSTTAAHGLNWDNSVMVASVVRTVQSLATTVERMDQSSTPGYI